MRTKAHRWKEWDKVRLDLPVFDALGKGFYIRVGQVFYERVENMGKREK
jgi:hypothetical protein